MNNVNGNGGASNQSANSANIPLMAKARYFASGVVVGVLVSPMVKRVVAQAQPKLEKLLDAMTGQAEGLVEKGSDLVAKAKDILAQSEPAAHDHDHDHDDDGGHKHSSTCTH